LIKKNRKFLEDGDQWKGKKGKRHGGGRRKNGGGGEMIIVVQPSVPATRNAIIKKGKRP
jgi:hypothetical protein